MLAGADLLNGNADWGWAFLGRCISGDNENEGLSAII